MEFFRLIILLASWSPDKSGNIERRFSKKCDLMRGKNSPLFEIASVFVRLDQVARFIVNVDHGVI
jgi:hypothetical protein